jgi:putative polyhydroxyalkanoate system protein
MATIEIDREHHLDRESARKLLEGIVGEVEKSIHVGYEWEGDDLKFAAKGVKGAIHLGEERVVVHAKLGLMLAPLKGKIKRAIEDYLDTALVPKA